MKRLFQWLSPRPRVVILVKEIPFRDKAGKDQFLAEIAVYEAEHGVKFLVLEGAWEIHEKAAA